ncbi:hypothetical protein ACIBSV_50255 [Embleya sp. NPDC050154]|uniref:hypothetical protein n=1 Tax=Embleya sp. NPDC050154 TaxID=3363988 RepID=UPI00379F4894
MDQQAYATVFNDSAIPLHRVTLFHRYETTLEQRTWETVSPGAEASPPLTVSYRTGFGETGTDFWWLEYALADGSVWQSADRLGGTLHAEDQGTTKRLTVRGALVNGFVPDHSIRLAWRHNEYDYTAWAAIELTNDFPVSALAVLEHKHETSTQRAEFPVLAPGATTTEPLIAHFSTGPFTGTDYWTLRIKLDIPPYDDLPAGAYTEFRNATAGYGCMLMASDNGLKHTFAVDGRGLTLGVASGGCFDAWETWNGYNTLAFLTVRNDFKQPVSTLTLSHQYSDDPIRYQTRALIPSGGTTSPMVAEYFTGATHPGLDYWHVRVYLEDGTWYENSANAKECWLESDDAKAPVPFAVSPDLFSLGLPSGGCSDTMRAKGYFAPSAGRDPDRRYDENAFLGSHNAYANEANGFWYAQQIGSLECQLAKGATTLLLDLWYDEHLDDICLKHEGYGILQPFVADMRLSDALGTIRTFLRLQSRDPVTLVFEDRTNGRHDLIRRAFRTSNTWDLVFNPDRHLVNGRWPSLTALFTQGRPLVVFTSSTSSPDFAYQWNHMSENVWAGASLDPETWLDSRAESAPLSRMPLCALNHFPCFSSQGTASAVNTVDALERHIDACHAITGRYPTYLNLDYWEIPNEFNWACPDYHGGALEAVYLLNRRLRGQGAAQAVRFEDGRALLDG